MRRDARELWSKRVERWRDSGLTAKEFAQELGINANTLAHWGWKLKEHREARRGRPPVKPGAQFVEVVPVASVMATATLPVAAKESISPAPEPLEVVLRAGVRIRVPVHFDSDALRRVVAALGAS